MVTRFYQARRWFELVTIFRGLVTTQLLLSYYGWLPSKKLVVMGVTAILGLYSPLRRQKWKENKKKLVGSP